jgi:hypothetical protein
LSSAGVIWYFSCPSDFNDTALTHTS